MQTVSTIPPLEGANPSSWLLVSYLELEARPDAVPSARRHARLALASWGLAALADAVEQVVAELVANGLRASERSAVGGLADGRAMAGHPVRMWLNSDRDRVLIQIWDASERMPERGEFDPEAESGRGLWLVEAFCEHWGVCRSRDISGKVVWGVLADGRS